VLSGDALRLRDRQHRCGHGDDQAVVGEAHQADAEALLPGAQDGAQVGGIVGEAERQAALFEQGRYPRAAVGAAKSELLLAAEDAVRFVLWIFTIQ
jgi:hypothetical protein